MTFELDSYVRVTQWGPDQWAVLMGPVVVGMPVLGDREFQENAAEVIRGELERKLRAAYYRFAVELRDKLRWSTGVGAEQTAAEILQMQKDLLAAQDAVLERDTTIEVRESELESIRGQFRIQFRELQLARTEIQLERAKNLDLHRKLQMIASNSGDTVARLAAEAALSQEGQ